MPGDTEGAVPNQQEKSPGLRRGSRRWVLWGTLIWLLLVGVGLVILWRHMLTPGPGALAPGDWPADSVLQPASDRATLLMWCHPRCPCTRASLEELSELVQHAGERVSVQVSFIRPDGCSLQWVQGDLWRQAKAIPGVRVVVDDGSEARRFGVRTSGQALIFGSDRRLLFSGGLTAGRGHQGDNAGLAAATRLAQAGAGKFESAPVFGCALFTVEGTRSSAPLQEGRR